MVQENLVIGFKVTVTKTTGDMILFDMTIVLLLAVKGQETGFAWNRRTDDLFVIALRVQPRRFLEVRGAIGLV